ncbi:MAG: hypothetical protein H8D47_04040 [Planctomycetes bacterium]|nr:hypothetical protein [Planctomycetota bacterium]
MKQGKEVMKKRSGKSKYFLIGGLIFFAVLVLLFLVGVPAYVSSAAGNRTILAKINESIDGEVGFSSLKMSWVNKGVEINDLKFTDVGKGSVVRVKRLSTKPHYGSLLRGSVSLGKTVIESPDVEIQVGGTEEPKQTAPSRPLRVTEGQGRGVVLPIEKMDMVLRDGNLRVKDASGVGVEVSGINSELNLRGPGKSNEFSVSMQVDESDVSAKGNLKPGKGWRLEGASGGFSVEVNELDLKSLEPLLALAGLEIDAEGMVWADIESEITDGRFSEAAGTMRAENLNISGAALRGDVLRTSFADVNVLASSENGMLRIEELKVGTDWMKMDAEGVFPLEFDSFEQIAFSDADIRAEVELDVGALASQMPRSLGIKEDMKVTAGRLAGSVRSVGEGGKRTVTADMSLSGLSGVVSGKSVSLSAPIEAGLNLSSEKDKMIMEKFEVSSAFADISAVGDLSRVEYKGDVDLSKMADELGEFVSMGGYEVGGAVGAAGVVEMDKKRISLEGKFSGKDIEVVSAEGIRAGEKFVDVNFGGVYDRVKKRLAAESVDVEAGFGSASVSDVSIGFDGAEDLSFGVMADVDISGLKPWAVLFAGLPKEAGFFGRFKGGAAVDMKGEVYHVVTDAAKIDGLKVTYPGKNPFEQEDVLMFFDGTINPAERVYNIDKFELISPEIKLKWKVSQKNSGGMTKLEARGDCEYSWEGITMLAAGYLPDGLELKGERKDVISLSSVYPSGDSRKLISNLNSSAKVGFDSADYMGLVFGPTEVEVVVAGGVMRILPFKAAVNNGELKFAASADFGSEPVVFSTPGAIEVIKGVEINDKLSSQLLGYVNPIFANAVNVRGKANFDCRKMVIPLDSQYKNDIEIEGTISLDDVRLGTSDLLGKIFSVAGGGVEQEIRVHPTDFILSGGILRYDNMQMDVGDNPVNFAGRIGLDKSLNMKVTLPYTAEGKTVRIGEEDKRRLVVPLGGTTDKPKLDLGGMIQGEIEQRLEEELRKGLERIFR